MLGALQSLRADAKEDTAVAVSAVAVSVYPVHLALRYANHRRLKARREERGGTSKELAKKAEEEAKQKEREARQAALDAKFEKEEGKAEEKKKEETGEGKEETGEGGGKADEKKEGEEKKEAKEEEEEKKENKEEEGDKKKKKKKEEKKKLSAFALLTRLYRQQPASSTAFSVAGATVNMGSTVLELSSQLAKAAVLKRACSPDATGAELLQGVIGIVGLTAGTEMLSAFARALLGRASTVATGALQSRVFRHILRLDPAMQDELGEDKLRDMLNDDTDTIASFMTSEVPDLINSMSTVGALGVTLWQTCPRVLVVTLGCLAGALEWRWALFKLASALDDDKEPDADPSNEVINNLRATRSFNREKVEQQRYHSFLHNSASLLSPQKLAQAAARTFNWLGFSWTFEAIPVYLGSLVPKGVLAKDEVAGQGDFSQQVFWRCFSLTYELGWAGDWTPAARRVFALLDREPTIALEEGYEPAEGLVGDVAFENVEFSYPTAGDDEHALDKCAFEVSAGQTVGLVGPSGCGKTTTLALLQRFYDPQNGRILLDGRDLKEYKPSFIYRSFGVVSQTPAIFNATVEENIRFGRPDATFEEVVEAARSANLHADLSRKADGYGMMATELSGGQKQRVAIARAILKNPRVLLLDEATSALDTKSERVVQQALDNLMRGRTCIAIAHRLSTIVNADQIIVMDAGKVKEQGTHKQLVELKGQYADLVHSQMAVSKDSEAEGDEKKKGEEGGDIIEVDAAIAEIEAELAAKGPDANMERALAALRAAHVSLEAEKKRLAESTTSFRRQTSDIFTSSSSSADLEAEDVAPVPLARLVSEDHERLRRKLRGAVHSVVALKRMSSSSSSSASAAPASPASASPASAAPASPASAAPASLASEAESP